MKKLILLMLLLSSTAFASSTNDGGGDGTLPVIKTIDIKFVSGTLIKLPKDIHIKVNKALKINESLAKKVNVTELNLSQKITLKNIDGELDIKVKSKELVKDEIPMLSSQKQIQENELFNEMTLMKGDISQQVTVTYNN